MKSLHNFKYLNSVAKSLNEESLSSFFDMAVVTRDGTRFSCSTVAAAAASDYLSEILRDVESIEEDKLIILADDSDRDVERLVQALKFTPGTLIESEDLQCFQHLNLNFRNHLDRVSHNIDDISLSNTDEKEMLSSDVRSNIREDVYLPSSIPALNIPSQHLCSNEQALEPDSSQTEDNELSLEPDLGIGSEISLGTEFEVTSSDVGIGPLPPQPELVKEPLQVKVSQGRKPSKAKKLKKLTNSSNFVSPSASSLQCYICFEYFPTQDELVFHFRTEHKAKPFKCAKCRTSFEEFGQLELHRAVHDVTASESYTCNICGNKYHYSSGLQQHLKDMHSNSKFTCDLCDKLFSAERYLKEHKKKQHSVIEKPKCPICNKTFLRKHELTVHTTIHTGERPYKCDICQKSFRTKSVLTMHMKMHKGLKDKVCKDCGKGFSQMCDLKKHMRNHTGERPYSCGQCEKKFKRKDYLEKHLKVHTNREDKRAAEEKAEVTTDLLLEDLEDVPMGLEGIVGEGGGLQVVRIMEQNFVICDIVDQREDLINSSEIDMV